MALRFVLSLWGNDSRELWPLAEGLTAGRFLLCLVLIASLVSLFAPPDATSLDVEAAVPRVGGDASSLHAGAGNLPAPGIGLSPAMLDRLSSPALQLMVSLDSRYAALEELHAAHALREIDPARYEKAIRDVDGAVEEVMAASGHPRQEVTRAAVDNIGLGGLYDHQGGITIGYSAIDGAVVARDSHKRAAVDNVLGLWFHESIHVRKPYRFPASESARHDFNNFPGYEEGLTASLADDLCRQLGLSCSTPAYTEEWLYIQAWHQLARAVEAPGTTLLGRAALYGSLEVGDGFREVAEEAYREAKGTGLSEEQAESLSDAADELFKRAVDPYRLACRSLESDMLARWRWALDGRRQADFTAVCP